MLPPLILIWLAGLAALGLGRLALEDWSLSIRRPLRQGVKQIGMVAGAAVAPLTGGGLLLALMELERRAALREWIMRRAEGPLTQLAIFLLNVAIFVLTILWELIYWIVTTISQRLNLEFSPLPRNPFPPSENFLDAFFDWLMRLPPLFWFLVKFAFFLLALLLILLYLVTRLSRARYVEGRYRVEEVEEERSGVLAALRARFRSIVRAGRRAPEPQDVVRRIYVRMIHLGIAQGMAWQPQHTPYEQEPSLRQALPQHGADIRLITDAYVRVRYAGAPLAPDDLRAVQAAWGRLQSAGIGKVEG
jgi:hypothetical protein